MNNININDPMYKDICTAMKQIFGEKLHSVILFGSYARGDYDEESDVDIAVLLNCSRQEMEQYHSAITQEMTNLALKYGLLVSITDIPESNYQEYKDTLPFYRNIAKEGVKLSA